MRRHTLASLAALTLGFVPVVAHAQAADQDVKCMLVSNVFASKETDAKRKQVATVAVAYYFGRADARLSPAQFKAAVMALSKQQMDKDVGAFMTACARTMQVKQAATAQTLQQIGREQQQVKQQPIKK